MKHKAIVFKIDSNYFTSSNFVSAIDYQLRPSALNDLKVIPKNNTEDVLSLIEQPVYPNLPPSPKTRLEVYLKPQGSLSYPTKGTIQMNTFNWTSPSGLNSTRSDC